MENQLFLTVAKLFDTNSQLKRLGGFMVTEMMLLISIRQRNWDVAYELAGKLDRYKFVYATVQELARRAMEQDLRAVYLLGLWSRIQWEQKQ